MKLLRVAMLSAVTLRLVMGAEVYKDNKDNKEYILADLLTPYRPRKEIRRMYPHVIPFSDMGHPAMRSYQFGFPEALRVGYSSWLPQQITFFANAKAKAAKFHGQTKPFNLVTWLQARRTENDELISVPVDFERLVSPDYDINAEFLNKLQLHQARPTHNLDSHYIYKDHNRDFLLGLWENWRESKFFHDEEQIWTANSLTCSDDLLCMWKRLFIIYQSTKIAIGQFSFLNMPTVDANLHTTDSLAASFWFAYCKLRRGSAEKSVRANCPNPCRNNPCADMAFTLIDSCEMVDGGVFENDFRCICIETAVWSKNKRECVMTDPCKVSTPCEDEGTNDCEFNPISGDLRCHCKSGYMGHDCGQLQDACFQRSDSRPTGNRACNVEGGGLCTPVPGTNYFTCSCSKGWLPAQTASNSQCNKTDSDDCIIDPNCQRPYDPCLSLACEIGDCVSTSRAAMCQCPITHYGPNCAMRRGHWSAWGPWSSCDPDCGDRRVRHRSRVCLGLECLGQPFESAWCLGSADCGVPDRLGNYPIDRWRTAYVLRNLLTALAIGTGLSMGAVLACQCCLSVALKLDRSILDGTVWERSHAEQMIAFRRLCFKSAIASEHGRVGGQNRQP